MTDEWVGKPFVEYAGHVAKELYEEGFFLLEGCDGTDYSAISSICDLCVEMQRVVNEWRRIND